MQNEFATEAEIKRSKKLLDELEKARAVRENALSECERLQLDCETKAMQISACQRTQGSEARQQMLVNELELLEIERDETLKKANAPVDLILAEIRKLVGRFLSNFSGWLSTVAHDNAKIDPNLMVFVQGIRRQLDGMRLAPLNEIVEVFEGARQKIEAWPIPDDAIEYSNAFGAMKRKMAIPRLADWFSDRGPAKG